MKALLRDENPSLADRLANRIRTRMQSEALQNGDVFRTEAQLASEFDVSRTIVREAVSRLRALGILEGRQGKGLVVCRPDLVQLMSESLPSLAGSEDDVRELVQLRYVLEVGGIELAIANADDDQIQGLQKIAEDFSKAVKSGGDMQQRNDLDIKFHTLLLEMTHSKLIAGFHNLLAQFFAANSPADASKVSAESAERTSSQHLELAAAIRDRDLERARYVIRTHMHGYLSDRSATNSK